MNLHERIKQLIESAPSGTLVPVQSLAELLAGDDTSPVPATPVQSATDTWLTKLWTCPAETRLGAREVAEAVNRPMSWVYRATSTKAKDRLPFRKFDGELQFTAGELRHWIRTHEQIIESGEIDSTDAERRSTMRVS